MVKQGLVLEDGDGTSEEAENLNADADKRGSTSSSTRSLGAQLKKYCCSFKVIELIAYTLLGILMTWLPYKIPQYERPIPYQLTAAGDVILDLTLNHSQLEETFNNVELILYAVVLPLIIQVCVIVAMVNKKQKNKRQPAIIYEYAVHNTWCSYIMAIGSTLCITEVLKRYVGRLRPTTYNACGFDIQTLQCIQTDSNDFRTSFPSGHASVSFCGCTLLTRYLWNTLLMTHHVVPTLSSSKKSNTTTTRNKLLATICLSPMLLAYAISASRIVENAHFAADGTLVVPHPRSLVDNSVVNLPALDRTVEVTYFLHLYIISCILTLIFFLSFNMHSRTGRPMFKKNKVVAGSVIGFVNGIIFSQIHFPDRNDIGLVKNDNR